MATGTASTGPTQVSVNPVSASEWAGASLAASGTCFYIHDQANGPGTTYGSSAVPADCTGTLAAGVSGASW